MTKRLLPAVLLALVVVLVAACVSDPPVPTVTPEPVSTQAPVNEPAENEEPEPTAAPEARTPVWLLVEFERNPYELPLSTDLYTENESYEGSFEQCGLESNSIDYRHIAHYRDDKLADLLFAYSFDDPPPRVDAGETITLAHSLHVSGMVKVGGQHYPSGRAQYSTDFSITPRTLSVASNTFAN